jgi:hypothetical protein
MLSHVESTAQISLWTSYTTDGCVDIVVMLDADKRLWIFEPFNVTQVALVKKLKRDVIALKANRQKEILMLITGDARLILLPLPSYREVLFPMKSS